MEDKVHRQTGPTAVPANVTVTVQKIPEVTFAVFFSLLEKITQDNFLQRIALIGHVIKTNSKKFQVYTAKITVTFRKDS